MNRPPFSKLYYLAVLLFLVPKARTTSEEKSGSVNNFNTSIRNVYNFHTASNVFRYEPRIISRSVAKMMENKNSDFLISNSTTKNRATLKARDFIIIKRTGSTSESFRRRSKVEKVSLSAKTIPKCSPDKGKEKVIMIKNERSPYSVILFMTNSDEDELMCAGSLLTPLWVLTSAFCLGGGKKLVGPISIYAGGYSASEWLEKKYAEDSQTRQSETYYSHPDFKSSEYRTYSDVALVMANDKFDMTDTVNTIKLSLQPWPLKECKTCKVTSYGRVRMLSESADDYTLKTFVMKVKSPCECFEEDAKPEMWICNEPQGDYGTCLGGVGASLVCDDEVRAVASLVLPFENLTSCDPRKTSFDCGSNNTINVLHNTCPYLAWINSHIKVFADSDLPAPSECVKFSHPDKNNTAAMFATKVRALDVALYLLLPNLLSSPYH